MRILRQRSSTRLGVSGFTLTEILVVLALIVLASAVAIPTISSYFRASLDSVSRTLASTIRDGYNSTIVTGNIHRLVYDIDKGQYWVESGGPGVLLDSANSQERKAQQKKWARSDAPEEASPFKLEKSVTRGKANLPSGIKFESIKTEQSPTALTTGIATTHFFPQGTTEQTLIVLTDSSDRKQTLAISATVGKTRVLKGAVGEREAFNAR